MKRVTRYLLLMLFLLAPVVPAVAQTDPASQQHAAQKASKQYNKQQKKAQKQAKKAQKKTEKEWNKQHQTGQH